MRKKLHTKIRNNPDYFFTKWLGVDLWQKERDIVLSIRDNRKTAVRSCHSSGKTFTIARAALWFLFAYPPAVVIDTAPTDRQVRHQFWRELRAAHARARRPLGGELLKTQYNLDEDWFAFGFSTRETSGEDVADKFQGFHGKNILIIVDEASGVSESIFEAIDGCLASGLTVRLVYIGNPTRNDGTFAQSFKDPSFKKIHISAFDTPNVRQKKIVIPGLATWEWVQEMIKKYGKDSDVVRVRVRGEFPKKSGDTYIGIDEVEGAINREYKSPMKVVKRKGQIKVIKIVEEEIIGVDPARYGDDFTAIVYRKGNYAKIIDKIHGQDTMQIAGKVKRLLIDDYKQAKAHIDIIGLGAGVFDRLHEQEGMAERVFGVNSAASAQDNVHFKNLRAQGWDNAKEWLGSGSLEPHEDWYQLAKPKYKILSSGQIQIESKEDMKKRGVSSPDVADALILTLVLPTEGGALETIAII